MMNKRESYLTTKFQTRDDSETGQLTLSGYFIKYDVETEIFPGYFEKIDKSAVESALENADIRALFNHDTSLVLGRTGNNTLVLSSDETGLRGDVYINQDDPQAVGIYQRIKRGDITGCSFGFYLTDSEDIQRDDGSFLTIVKGLELLEVSPCTFPAYPQTEIAARKQDFETSKKRALAVRKKLLKEKYKHE